MSKFSSEIVLCWHRISRSLTPSLPHPSLSLSLFHLHFPGCNCLPDTKDATIRSKRKFWQSCGVWENPIKGPTAGKWTSFPTTNLFKARKSWPMQQWTFTKHNNYFVTADIRCRPGVYAGKYVYRRHFREHIGRPLKGWTNRRSQDFCLGGTWPTPPSLASVVHTFQAVVGS